MIQSWSVNCSQKNDYGDLFQENDLSNQILNNFCAVTKTCSWNTIIVIFRGQLWGHECTLKKPYLMAISLVRPHSAMAGTIKDWNDLIYSGTVPFSFPFWITSFARYNKISCRLPRLRLTSSNHTFAASAANWKFFWKILTRRPNYTIFTYEATAVVR